MANQAPQPPQGMRDYLPDEYRERLALADRIRAIYARYGYAPIETPAMERLDVLKGKGGAENEKLMFEVLKRGEKLETAREGDALSDHALRFDLTVPLARFYATHRAELPPVFRCQHVGPVWRAERPQKGRFREFIQCDVDAVGSSSPLMEAEVILATAEVFQTMLGGGFAIHLNDRRLLTETLGGLSVPPEKQESALIAVDKLDKVGEEGVLKELAERGISPELLPRLKNAQEPAALQTIRALVESAPNAPRLVFDPFLARGLGYYTGPIFEVRVEGFPGALGGGGRYDSLIGRFLEKPVPAVGFSIGFERLLLVLKEKKVPLEAAGKPQVFIPLAEPQELGRALALANALRAHKLNVVVQPDPMKPAAQLKMADEVLGIPYALIPEADGKVVIKDLKERHASQPMSAEEAAAELRYRLKLA